MFATDAGRTPAVGEADRPGSAWSRLSPRERQVVDLLADGFTAHRIGSVLGISPRTVGKHLQNAYAKLGQHDRLVIAVQARTAIVDVVDPRKVLPR